MDQQNYYDRKLSFEFFPPKTAATRVALQATATQFSYLHPEYFSVTYGANRSANTNTLETILALRETTQVNAVPHLSCIGSTREKIRLLLTQFQQHGIRRIVALRGDLLPQATDIPTDFHYARDLVHFIRAETGDYFHIDVAAYPEFHPQMPCAKTDLVHFKNKIDAGANGAITQYFFNIDAYFHFVDNCLKLGIKAPIIPGIMPIYSYQQLLTFSEFCGAEIPRWLRLRLEDIADDTNALHAFGSEIITELCLKLLIGGAQGLHFYTLNKLEPCLTICRNLSLAGWQVKTAKSAAWMQKSEV